MSVPSKVVQQFFHVAVFFSKLLATTVHVTLIKSSTFTIFHVKLFDESYWGYVYILFRNVKIWFQRDNRFESQVWYNQFFKLNFILQPRWKINMPKYHPKNSQLHTLIYSLHLFQDVLDQRLDSRVDSMLQNGLIRELLDFHDRYNKDRIEKNE